MSTDELELKLRVKAPSFSPSPFMLKVGSHLHPTAAQSYSPWSLPQILWISPPLMSGLPGVHHIRLGNNPWNDCSPLLPLLFLLLLPLTILGSPLFSLTTPFTSALVDEVYRHTDWIFAKYCEYGAVQLHCVFVLSHCLEKQAQLEPNKNVKVIKGIVLNLIANYIWLEDCDCQQCHQPLYKS